MLFSMQNTPYWEWAFSGGAKERAHPSSKGCDCLHFLPAWGCREAPCLHSWSRCLAPGQGFAVLGRSCRLTGMGQQSLFHTNGPGTRQRSSRPRWCAAETCPRSHQPSSSARHCAAWRQQQSPLALAVSAVSTSCNARQTLADPTLPRQGPAVPPRAAQGSGMLPSTARARPWLCNPNKRQQQAVAEVVLQMLPSVAIRPPLSCSMWWY